MSDAAPHSSGPGLDFPTSWARRPFARTIRTVVQDFVIVPLVWLLAPTTRRGTAALQRQHGPFIVAANHQSHADTSIIVAALPRSMRRRLVVAAASDVFFTSRLRAAFAALVYNAIPIERQRVDRRSANLAKELVGEGWGLLIFPEGHRSEDGRLLEFKGGAAYLSDKTGAPVIPCYLEDTRFVVPRLFAKSGVHEQRQDRSLRTHVSATFGPAILPDRDESSRRLGRRIEDEVVRLGRDVAGDPLAAVSDAG